MPTSRFTLSSSKKRADITAIARPTLVTYPTENPIITPSHNLTAQVDETSLKAMGDALEWPMSMYFDESSELDGGLVDLDDGEGASRRSLLWRRMHYYISYGALSANRIPCPARSGRSYYSHNCFKSRIPVNPYSRGCSSITRCRR
ncbi:hypothetical protein POTOM_028162 [Populus tomentosa]|uniref:Uncharacterized protein n=1 Tax=Populus tomentosa TaxID=118781 RepID=A0A8X7ZIL8_POPTO|nr:hypothetical protein POTOM_028162 [Populus tomentosa]